MRLVFVTLLLANASLYGWASFKDELFPRLEKNKPPQQASSATSASESIVLLSESDPVGPSVGVGLADEVGLALPEVVRQSLVDVVEEEFEAGVVETLGVAESKLCRMVGPFKNDLIAKAFVERLAALDVEARLNDREVSEGERYWVFLEPLEGREAALARLVELTDLGVDSYVIQRGRLKNGISLGVFSRERLANERVKDMRRLGLEPKLEMQERAYRELWVMLGMGEDLKIGGVGWSNLLKDQPNLESRQSFCVLDVASEGNFH